MSQKRIVEAEPPPLVSSFPSTEGEREAVRHQLERILSNSLFKHSRRYPVLLRYVVERALDGRAGTLKERTLGTEVFGRDPDYDTNLDPVVRIAAGEIRKRIAQYYHEPGRENELRIDLPSGTYVPEFHAPRPVESKPWLERQVETIAAHRTVALLSVGLALTVGLLGVGWRFSATALDRFWGPVWDGAGGTLLCIGGAGLAPEITGAWPTDDGEKDRSVTGQIRRDYVNFSDVTTLSRIAGLFEGRSKRFTMATGAQTTFADLRRGPVVLVGGFNNGWTLRAVSPLRYGFRRDAATGVEWIEDRQNPERRDWQVDAHTPNQRLTDDYAIVARFVDPTTERMVVAAAGLVQYGTVAAGEFLTNPVYLEEVMKKAPPNWRKQNLEAVIATQVINGHSGAPKLVASYFW